MLFRLPLEGSFGFLESVSWGSFRGTAPFKEVLGLGVQRCLGDVAFLSVGLV